MSHNPTATADNSVDVAARDDMTASAVLSLLLATDYQGPWTRAEIERELSGSRVEVQDALADLCAAGLIHIHDELVFSARAARRMDELEM